MRRLIAFTLCVLASSVVCADEQVNNRKIVQTAHYNTFVAVELNTPASNSDACSSAAFVTLAYLDKREMYAALLAAHLAGRTIDLGLSGCLQGYPSIYRI